jgi:hypothetical protein
VEKEEILLKAKKPQELAAKIAAVERGQELDDEYEEDEDEEEEDEEEDEDEGPRRRR